MKPKKLVILLTAILGLFLLIPAIAYIFEFWNSPISHDPNRWGVLGDYIGGILNPIISLASLGILGYLSYLLSLQSTKEGKKLFILEKKMEAYHDLTMHIKGINMITENIKRSTTLLNIVNDFPLEKKFEPVLKMNEELIASCQPIKQFYFTLMTFNVRYSHLFEYDFSSGDFKEFISESKSACQKFDLVIDKFTRKSDNELKAEDLMLSEKFQELSVKVINDIRREVLINDTEN